MLTQQFEYDVEMEQLKSHAARAGRPDKCQLYFRCSRVLFVFCKLVLLFYRRCPQLLLSPLLKPKCRLDDSLLEEENKVFIRGKLTIP